MRVSDLVQLSKFFAMLTIKEHMSPGLHVRPLVAELFLTENCNLRCISCGCWREVTRHELTTDEWKNVLAQLAKLKIYKVNFTGGEPLLRRDSVELMQFAQTVGIRHLHLNTNATLLDASKLVAVLEAGVRSFNVSVDGPAALHNRIRGRPNAFEQTVEHLRNVIAQRDRYKLRVRLNFTVMRENVMALPDMADLAQELGVRLYLNLATDSTFLFRHREVATQAAIPADEVSTALARLEVIARANRKWLPRYSDLRYVPGHFTDVIQKDLPCAESQLKLMIHSRGEIGGCWGHDPTFNIREMAISEVIEDQYYREEHARFFRKECNGCGSNYSLNLRWRPGTYVADAFWRSGFRSLVEHDS